MFALAPWAELQQKALTIFDVVQPKVPMQWPVL